MTEDAKKVWKVMETDFGWENQPKDFHLEYFEDIVKATKQALTIPDVVGQSEQLFCSCENPNGFKEMEEGKETCSQCQKPY